MLFVYIRDEGRKKELISVCVLIQQTLFLDAKGQKDI